MEEDREENIDEKKEVEEEIKEEHKEHKKDDSDKKSKRKSNESSLTDKFRANPYLVSTLVLGIIVILMLASSFGGMSGHTISPDQVGESVIKFVQTQTGGEGELVSVEKDDSGFYKVLIDYQGQEIPLYATMDGSYLVQGITPLVTEEEVVTETPKEKIPEVGLYIWSYCPYGVTALGPFAEVASLLGDVANFKVYLYYAGHGDFEVQQNKIQACIQDLGYEKEYWNYVQTFASKIYEKCYGDIDCDMTESVDLMNSVGIDSKAVLECVDSQGETLLDKDAEVAQNAGVTGSPSLLVNGFKVSASRTAEAYKTAVCEGFEDAPNECGTELDSTGTTASGSC